MIPRRTLWMAGLALSAFACTHEEADPAGMGGGDGGGGGGGFAFPVTFLEVEQGTVAEQVSLSGDVATLRRATLAFERGGRIAELLVEEGQAVEAGQVLARLKDDVLLADKAAAEAAHGAALAQKTYAEQELDRTERMAGVVADTDRDQWKSEVAIRSAVVMQREAEVVSLDERLGQGTLVAPFAGVVVKRHLTLGSFANPGDAVVEIVDLVNREVRVELPQDLAMQLQPGIAVEIHADALADGPLIAQLDAILPSSQSRTRTFTGLVRLPAEADLQHRLLPGAFVRVRLVARQADGALVVPLDALVQTPEGPELFAIDGEGPHIARIVPVKVLARSANRVAVAPLEPEALKIGSRIVVTGTDNIADHAPLLLHPHRAPSTDDRAVMEDPVEADPTAASH